MAKQQNGSRQIKIKRNCNQVIVHVLQCERVTRICTCNHTHMRQIYFVNNVWHARSHNKTQAGGRRCSCLWGKVQVLGSIVQEQVSPSGRKSISWVHHFNAITTDQWQESVHHEQNGAMQVLCVNEFHEPNGTNKCDSYIFLLILFLITQQLNSQVHTECVNDYNRLWNNCLGPDGDHPSGRDWEWVGLFVTCEWFAHHR